MPAGYRCQGDHVTIPVSAEAAERGGIEDSGVGETWVCFLHLLNKLCDIRQSDSMFLSLFPHL